MRTTFILLTWTLGLQTLSALDWPQWRGPNRDGVSKETGLLKSWPAAGPARAWIFSNAGALGTAAVSKPASQPAAAPRPVGRWWGAWRSAEEVAAEVRVRVSTQP